MLLFEGLMSCSSLLFPTETGGSPSGPARGVRDECSLAQKSLSTEITWRNSVLPVSWHKVCVCVCVGTWICTSGCVSWVEGVGVGETGPSSALWLREGKGLRECVEAHLSATSRRGSTVHCHRFKPSMVATCQIILLCSFPVLFSTSTRETFPCNTPRMSQDIRSCEGEKSQKDEGLMWKGNSRSPSWNPQGFCWRLSRGLTCEESCLPVARTHSLSPKVVFTKV